MNPFTECPQCLRSASNFCHSVSFISLFVGETMLSGLAMRLTTFASIVRTLKTVSFQVVQRGEFPSTNWLLIKSSSPSPPIFSKSTAHKCGSSLRMVLFIIEQTTSCLAIDQNPACSMPPHEPLILRTFPSVNTPSRCFCQSSPLASIIS